jgi:hypothetical protein
MGQTEPQMKGAMLAEFLRWYATHYDSEPVRRFVQSDPCCVRARLDADRPSFGVVPSEWYSAALFHRLLDVAVAPMSQGERALFVRRSTEAVSGHMIRGVYGALFSLIATPDRYVRHIQRAWNQLHNTGVREVVLRPNEAESIIREWPAHHPILCMMVHATTHALFERMLGKHADIERVRCVSQGHADCMSRLWW